MLKLLAEVSFALILQGQTIQQGLYVKFHAPASDDEAQQDFAILQSNPLLNGVLITALWKDIEPARDQYDFSSLDRGIAAVRKAGKHYKLAIVPGMNSPGTYIPAARRASRPR